MNLKKDQNYFNIKKYLLFYFSDFRFNKINVFSEVNPKYISAFFSFLRVIQ